MRFILLWNTRKTEPVRAARSRVFLSLLAARHVPFALLMLITALAAFAADPATLAKGAAEEKRCVGCHGLRIIGTQRLNRTGWERELDKMVRWGATIKDRDALLHYLVATYGDDKPAAPLPRSESAKK
ncbi:MAG: hypothetical protein HY820_04645 [Acidobacteria bacterium]|nr:hypothetical protein [Acidobacteriota bacterium]